MSDHCNHNLIVIYTDPAGHDEEHVVRWCDQCGSIVVDIDYDGRTRAGGIMEMKSPKDYNNNRIKEGMQKNE
jgi:hypothetical protein